MASAVHAAVPRQGLRRYARAREGLRARRHSVVRTGDRDEKLNLGKHLEIRCFFGSFSQRFLALSGPEVILGRPPHPYSLVAPRRVRMARQIR
jgi:hypothetical protein